MKLHRSSWLLTVLLSCLTAAHGVDVAAAAAAEAPATMPSTRPSAGIRIEAAVEEGKKVLHATVTVDGKPLRDAKVQFGAARTFGVLMLGEDATDDDGVAAVNYPQDLPGNARRYVEAVEAMTSVPISVIGVGPGREESIVVRSLVWAVLVDQRRRAHRT